MTGKRFRVNELVKYNYSEIGEYTDENHTDNPLRNDEVVELLNELHDENKKLKAQLLYDGDGVCNICKHQCLVETGKYYVAKCEKEHEECSKVDLQYCEDFELVRDYE